MHKLALTLMCAYPLATLALTSNAVAAEEGIEARTHNGTEVMKQESEKAVPADRVFRRPTIVFKNKEKKAEEEAKEKEKFLFPSLAFLAHFDQWKLRLGDVVFLQDNVFSLFNKASRLPTHSVVVVGLFGSCGLPKHKQVPCRRRRGDLQLRQRERGPDGGNLHVQKSTAGGSVCQAHHGYA